MSNQQLDAMTIRERLGLGEESLAWLQELEALGAPPEPVRLPSPDDLPALLGRITAPDEQIDEAIAALPQLEADPALWWLLERCHHLLIQKMGEFAPLRPWPSPPAALGAPGRYLYVWAFLATLDAVRKYHQSRGIPDDVAWTTLADLGRNMGIHKRTYGVGGLSTANWITLHFRGAIYELGRLQFNRSRINQDPATLESLGVPFRHGDSSLGMHIPESGPMTPEACDVSIARAYEFFPRYFPEDGSRVVTCGSWLLDDQLAEYLPASSNIVRFQQRFKLFPNNRICDEDIIWFVFRRRGASIDDLPQRTALERAVVKHLRDGRHWLARQGWIAL